MSRPLVSVVGAGQVGATTAHLLMLKGLADVVLIDVVEGLARGKALDLLQAAATEGLPSQVTGTSDYAALEGSQVVVITAGLARKPGMSRDDLLMANAGIVGPVAEQVARHAPNAVLIVVTNPLDVMTALAWKRTGFPRQRVLGMAGVLDSGRLRTFIAERLRVPPVDIEAMVLGSHGDLMVSVKSSIAVEGRPLSARLSADEIDRLIARTRDGGAEIVALLKTSSAYYAPASGIVRMVQAILKDERRVLPASVWLEGEYGLKDVCIGVPVELAASGWTRVIVQPLAPDEQQALSRAAGQVREGIATVLSTAPAKP
ncbi:MAG: malate dehydrogenase [Candidatus Omnitrophica bacterium]|nr:malate dehydrogenase [Candidatus Omnitrophota bacterium]